MASLFGIVLLWRFVVSVGGTWDGVREAVWTEMIQSAVARRDTFDSEWGLMHGRQLGS